MFRESDWKVLSSLQPLAIDRLCARYLREAGETIENGTPGNYATAFHNLYNQIKEANQEFAYCFGHWSRSNAIILLLNWRRQQIITDEEYQRFSPELRDQIARAEEISGDKPSL